MTSSGHVDTRWKHLWTRRKPCGKAINRPLCPRVHKTGSLLYWIGPETHAPGLYLLGCVCLALLFLGLPENCGHRVSVDTGEKNPRSEAKNRVSTSVSTPVSTLATYPYAARFTIGGGTR